MYLPARDLLVYGSEKVCITGSHVASGNQGLSPLKKARRESLRTTLSKFKFFSFALQYNPTRMRGNLGLKLQNNSKHGSEAFGSKFYIWWCFLCIQVSFGNWETC